MLLVKRAISRVPFSFLYLKLRTEGRYLLSENTQELSYIDSESLIQKRKESITVKVTTKLSLSVP